MPEITIKTINISNIHTQAEWVTSNLVLRLGEIGIESDTGLRKTGDGATAWNSLEYDKEHYLLTTGTMSGSITLPFSRFHNRVVYRNTSLTAATISATASATYLGIPQYALFVNAYTSALVLTLSSGLVSTDTIISVAAGTQVEIGYIVDAVNGSYQVTITASAPISVI